MKIVIATPLFPPELGVPASYVYTLSKKLAKEHTVTVVAYANHIEKIEGVRIKKVKKDNSLLVRLFNYTRKLHTSAQSADVIYTQKGVASGLPATIVGWLTNTPVVVNYIEDEAWERLNHIHPTLHQGQFRTKQKIPGEVWGIWHTQHFSLKRARAVVAPSQYLAGEVARTHSIKRNKVHTLYTPLEKTVTLPFTTEKEPRKIFVNTSLLTWKDVATTIRTIALLKEKFPDVKLFIAGDGPEKTALTELVQDKMLQGHVTFLGHVSNAERMYHLQTASVFVSPSLYEDRPDILFPAMKIGVPIAATDVPGQREHLAHKENVLLLPPGNAKKCAEMLEQIFTDDVLCEKLVQRAKKLYENEFFWDKHLEGLLTIFQKVKQYDPVRDENSNT